MNILVCVAHPDDEMLGLEGTLIKHRQSSNHIDYYIAGKGRGDKLDQKFDTKPLLYWIHQIEQRLKQKVYNLIFTHWNKDRNKDHRIISEAVTTAARPWIFKGNILFFETPDADNDFIPDCFSPLTFNIVNQKISNIKNKYKKELKDNPHPRSEDNLLALMNYRGIQCGSKYAEAFKTYRIIYE